MPCTGRTNQALRAEMSTRRQACRLVSLLSSRPCEAAEGLEAVEVTLVPARSLPQRKGGREPQTLSFLRRSYPRSIDHLLGVHRRAPAALVFGRGRVRTLCH